MLAKFCIVAVLLSLLLLVSIAAVPADKELFQDTIAIQEGDDINSVTPFKAIFFPKMDTSACRFCRPPCGGFFCCFGKWPRCCVNDGRCSCCG